MSAPVIIEAALNGGTPRRLNPRVPITAQEVAADAIACLDAGAAFIHNHTGDPVLGGSGIHDPQPYLDAWRIILAARPDALLYPTMAGGGPHVTIEARYAHIVALARAGVLAQGLVDPGTTNFGRLDETGRPRPDDIVYQNTYRDSVYMVETCRELGVGLSVSIFEPGFLRFILAYHAAGALPPGSMIKLYFGAGKTLFGLPPTNGPPSRPTSTCSRAPACPGWSPHKAGMWWPAGWRGWRWNVADTCRWAWNPRPIARAATSTWCAMRWPWPPTSAGQWPTARARRNCSGYRGAEPTRSGTRQSRRGRQPRPTGSVW
jgi:hypothetical protein